MEKRTFLSCQFLQSVFDILYDHCPLLFITYQTSCYSFFLLFSHDHIEIIAVKQELLFFRQRDGPWIPALRLVHKCKLLDHFSCNLTN